jgi:hypothetical protein
MTVMVRLSEQTRDRVLKLAEEYGGVSADEAVRRLLDEHWQRQAIEAVNRFRQEDPEGWAEYLREAEELDAGSAQPVDPWHKAE